MSFELIRQALQTRDEGLQIGCLRIYGLAFADQQLHAAVAYVGGEVQPGDPFDKIKQACFYCRFGHNTVNGESYFSNH